MLHRIWIYRLLLVTLIVLGVISYQLDLYDNFPSWSILRSFFDERCSTRTNSFLILYDFRSNYSKNSIALINSSKSVVGKLSILGSNTVGNKYMGLGNQMYVFASMYGIARQFGFDLIVGCDEYSKLNFLEDFEHFRNNIDRLDRLSKYVEKEELRIDWIHRWRCCAFEYLTDHERNRSIAGDLLMIDGFLQSWKYFDRWRPELRELFKFKRSIDLAAKEDFKELVGDKIANDVERSIDLERRIENRTRSSPQIDCIHIRRGDFAFRSNALQGYVQIDAQTVSAGIKFLNRTFYASVFNDRISANRMLLLFSDDPEWCSENFSSLDEVRSQILIVKKQKSSVAMRTIAKYCANIFLLSSGSTFGWWSAYLSDRSNSKIYYNSNYVTFGSILEREMTESGDIFPPSWTPVELQFVD